MITDKLRGRELVLSPRHTMIIKKTDRPFMEKTVDIHQDRPLTIPEEEAVAAASYGREVFAQQVTRATPGFEHRFVRSLTHASFYILSLAPYK